MFALVRLKCDKLRRLYLLVFARSPRSLVSDEEVLSSCNLVKQLRVVGFEGKLTRVRQVPRLCLIPGIDPAHLPGRGVVARRGYL